MDITRVWHRYSVLARRGFTLIEMIVVTGILVVVTGVILSGTSGFGGKITLRNLAYDIALSIRESQTYGISVRRFSSSEFAAGYGIHFRTSSPTSYILFADVDGNGHYSGDSELVDSFNIGRGFTISDICILASGAGDATCGSGKVDIVFIRPEPDARIRADDASTLSQRAEIQIRSPRADVAYVVVEATGQIAVEAVQ